MNFLQSFTSSFVQDAMSKVTNSIKEDLTNFIDVKKDGVGAGGTGKVVSSNELKTFLETNHGHIVKAAQEAFMEVKQLTSQDIDLNN